VLTGRERSDIGLNPNWRTGHYSIATLAIDQIGNANLKDLLNKNGDLFSFDLNRPSRIAICLSSTSRGFLPSMTMPVHCGTVDCSAKLELNSELGVAKRAR